MSEKTSTRHEEWLKKERPQTFAALQDTEGDSEDLKSCCVRLEQEVEELREFKEKVNKELRIWNNEECCFSSSFRGMDNIENLMLEGGEG